jgi:GMP synthase (glutamine-hydrolysing)
MQHNVLILDFGSQYTQLIARRVRELNIFCEIFPYNHIPSDISSYKADAPHPDLSQIRGKLPLLAVCYGAQYLAHFSGGEVAASNTREYGRANLSFIKEKEVFFDGVSENSQVWMSHSDSVKALPTNGIKLASTHDVEFAAYRIKSKSSK